MIQRSNGISQAASMQATVDTQANKRARQEPKSFSGPSVGGVLKAGLVALSYFVARTSGAQLPVLGGQAPTPSPLPPCAPRAWNNGTFNLGATPTGTLANIDTLVNNDIYEATVTLTTSDRGDDLQFADQGNDGLTFAMGFKVGSGIQVSTQGHGVLPQSAVSNQQDYVIPTAGNINATVHTTMPDYPRTNTAAVTLKSTAPYALQARVQNGNWQVDAKPAAEPTLSIGNC